MLILFVRCLVKSSQKEVDDEVFSFPRLRYEKDHFVIVLLRKRMGNSERKTTESLH